ncbi:MAG: CocE/NonD family hydrolase [Tepidisphaeraceae bacterium]|jgi:hypothetical protein
MQYCKSRQSHVAHLLLSTLLACRAVAIFAQTPAPAPAVSSAAQEQQYLREHYTKYEYRVPMRDGVRLFTAVYAPKDESQRRPILFTRTPYGIRPYGVDRYPDVNGWLQQYAHESFILVLQDVRGIGASEGEFVHMRPQRPDKSGSRDIDESTDAWDTIDWLVKNIPNHNGNVGMIGISYAGFYAAAGMIDSHPALKCVSPQAPIADWFVGDDFHHNGTLYLAHAFGFLSRFGQRLHDPTRDQPKPFDYKTPDGYEFYLNLGPLANADRLYFKGKIAFWPEMMEHGTYDAFWQARNLRPHLKNIKAAVLTVGGWYDAEDLFGTLSVYREVGRLNPAASNMLVMGPWPHGGWARSDGERLGHVSFFAKTAEFYREEMERPFLKHFLNGDQGDQGDQSDHGEPKFDLPKAYVFETGTNRWRRYDAWPPKKALEKAIYFRSGGRLSFDPPGNDASAFDEYLSDPAKPVPCIPYIAGGMTPEHMVDDQRFAATRPDVLVYQTDVLEEDITLAGPITAQLQVSTTGTDADWVVKLIDVYTGDHPSPAVNPDNLPMGGYQQLVRGEAFRGKFRNSFERPEPFEPGRVTKVQYLMPDVNHTFRRGHRLMVQVQSTWFPLVDRNPQKFCDIYRASAADFQKATQRVYHSPEANSCLRVQVLSATENIR